MTREPGEHFVAARAFGPVGTHVDERHAPMSCGEQSDRVAPPRRREHYLCAGSVEKLFQPSQQLLVDNVGKLAWVRRLVAVQDAVDVQKYHLHDGQTELGASGSA